MAAGSYPKPHRPRPVASELPMAHRCTACAPCSTILPPSPATPWRRACPGPSRSRSSPGPRRSRTRPSSSWACGCRVPSNAPPYFLIGPENQQVDSCLSSKFGLAKRISDKLFEMAYEEARMRGDLTRVFLGAMLGVVVVVLFFPSFGEQVLFGESGWAPGMAAFIAGLGVKPVYAAFESLSEELARRFKGSAEGGSK